MKLSLQNFSTLVEGMAASVQGSAAALVDLTVGSVLRAILEANASVALWLQWLIVQVLAASRLATSSGADCDSFGADFGFVRLPPVAATGQVSFSRFTPSVAAFVPAGTMVSTAGNAQSFVVIGDASNPAYDAGQAGYVIAAGIGSVAASVAAEVPGVAGNVQAGAISLINSAIAGVDTVSNGAALTGGMDAESDTDFRLRFTNYLASLSRATNVAIGSAIAGIQQGLSYAVAENLDQAGNGQMGHFVVTVDDGTGNPGAPLLAVVQAAVDAVRPVGTSFAVQGPVVSAANVSVTLAVTSEAMRPAAVAAVGAAFSAYVAGLTIGAGLSYTRLAQVAYDASPYVTNLQGLLLNGGTVDLAPSMFGVVRAGAMSVS